MIDSGILRSGWTSDSIERTTSEEPFAYDWDSIYPGFQPGNTYWDDPRPMNDSPSNPRRPGYYTGPTMRRLIAGAGVEEMGDLQDLWVGGPPQLPQPGPPVDRMAQLVQQMALLQDENLRLQHDVADLRQRAMQ